VPCPVILPFPPTRLSSPTLSRPSYTPPFRAPPEAALLASATTEVRRARRAGSEPLRADSRAEPQAGDGSLDTRSDPSPAWGSARSEEHTSALQSLRQLVCRPLLEKVSHLLLK